MTPSPLASSFLRHRLIKQAHQLTVADEGGEQSVDRFADRHETVGGDRP